jgi:hypothetical protein
MRFALLFEGTGDHIVLESLQDDVLRFYIQNLESAQRNRFVPFDGFVNEVKSKIAAIQKITAQVNEWPPEIRPSWITALTVDQCLDQSLLNQLHADWVKSMTDPWDIQQKRLDYESDLVHMVFDQFPDDLMCPPTAVVLEKLGLLDLYRQLNSDIHRIECQFDRVRFKSSVPDWIEFLNPFGPGIASNDIAHFSIAFNHLGRTQHNKWETFDTDLVCSDQNTFHELLPFVDLRLTRSETNGYSPEYLAWCSRHKLQPSGNYICLGNIPDLEQRLSYYRGMIFNNLDQGNSFSIQL